MIRSGVGSESHRLARTRDCGPVCRHLVDRNGVGPALSSTVSQAIRHLRRSGRRSTADSGFAERIGATVSRRSDWCRGAAAAVDRTADRSARRAPRGGRTCRVGTPVARPRRAPGGRHRVDRCGSPPRSRLAMAASCRCSCTPMRWRGSVEVAIDLRHQLGAYLDMVTMLLAGNTGYGSPRASGPSRRRVAVSVKTPAADARGGHNRPEPRASTRTRRRGLRNRRTRAGSRNCHPLGERGVPRRVA